MIARKRATLSLSMHEHGSSSLLETFSLEEEKEVRLYILEELKSIIKKYALYYAPDEKEPTPQQFFAWIETLGEGEIYPADESFDEQVLAHDVRRFEKLYKELANIALKKPIGREVREESGSRFITLEHAFEVLGRENVHGPEDVELLLGFKPANIPPIPYTREDLKKSREIKEKTGVEEMLVLFVHDEEGNPLTGEKLNELIQKKYDELDLGKFLYAGFRYQDAAYYKEPGLRLEWKLVTKTCLPDSYDKWHHFEAGDWYTHEDTQEYVIEQFAKTTGIPRIELKRPEPFALAYAVALHLVATENLKGKGSGERLLGEDSHWSDVPVTLGHFVSIRHDYRLGLRVNGRSHNYSTSNLGVCLSR